MKTALEAAALKNLSRWHKTIEEELMKVAPLQPR